MPRITLSPAGHVGAREAAAMSRDTYKVQWSRYKRCFTPATARGNYSEKVPESIALKIGDCYSKKFWFLVWLENNQKWTEVMGTEEFRKSTTRSQETFEAWLTEAEWADLTKSQLVASEVKKAAIAAGNCKPHPTVPHEIEACLYKGTVGQSYRTEFANIIDNRDARLKTDKCLLTNRCRRSQQWLEKQSKKDAFAASPAGQAEQWLKSASKEFERLTVTKVGLEASAMQSMMKSEWMRIMDKHHDKLLKIKHRMEAVRYESETPTIDLFVSGKRSVENLKRDQKELRGLITKREIRRGKGREGVGPPLPRLYNA